jgi:hypothetical protein
MKRKLPYIVGLFPNQHGHLIARLSNRKLMPIHRYIWISNYGSIPRDCEIHHLDLNPLNNNIENLVLATIVEHKKIHNRKLKVKDIASVPNIENYVIELAMLF